MATEMVTDGYRFVLEHDVDAWATEDPMPLRLRAGTELVALDCVLTTERGPYLPVATASGRELTLDPRDCWPETSICDACGRPSVRTVATPDGLMNECETNHDLKEFA